MTGSAAENITEIRLGGIGGQGIALAGSLLGRAATIHDGKEAVFTQTHGPEARGGASRADVIISAGPVDYPFVIQPDILCVLFQEAYERFRPKLKPGGLLIVDADLVSLHADDAAAVRLPATRKSAELGTKLAANIVLLGCLIAITNVVSRRAMEEAIRAKVSSKHLQLDLQALQAGFEFGAGAQPDD
ncbi:MAG: 2-oxoacid:acceptor oxidoreductase family protein [Gammaproteobacteria bacterium]|nr:2-oxoacid:acceptor oxidoreductase family protein [Gammaproteobacteria bacterium]NNF62398.1 2-oxoacid:ferredoxin oxidoreductase subunit gamma [Gammaproteobacteria bacterium]NNM20912.1 2-oxoacid:ferredoxin oxidoreductase subunit gamma [Gammaproteobacteria bacterium]